MALAFELPEHLPRSGHGQDKSTTILSKIGQADEQSLNADLTASWLAELDATIDGNKSRISERTQDLAFERQLKASMIVQAQLQELSRSVDLLDESLNSADTGIRNTLLRTLSTHGTLAVQASDSDVMHRALAHLLHIQEELMALSNFVQQGKLSEAAETSRRVQNLIAAAPNPLGQAKVMLDIRKRHRTLNDRVQEQINDAYARSFAFTVSSDSSVFTVLGSTIVTPTSTEITLPAILRSFTSDALSTHLSTFRRDIMTRFVEPILLCNRSLMLSAEEDSHTLALSSSHSPHSPLQSLRRLMDFLKENIFSYVPPTHTTFPAMFHTPIITAILTHLLKSSIPSSLSFLPPFLQTVNDAVRFEEDFRPVDTRDTPIRNWAEDVAGHYEKKRREDVMHFGRQVIRNKEEGIAVCVEVSLKQSRELQVQEVGSEVKSDAAESGWNFEKEASEEGTAAVSKPNSDASMEELSKDSWEKGSRSLEEENTTDGWDWSDEDDNDIEDVDLVSQSSPPNDMLSQSPEKDPWGDGWNTQLESQPQPIPSMSQRTPKLAKRLEKFSAKSKGPSVSNTPIVSPSFPIAPKPDALPPKPVHVRPMPLKSKRVVKETYIVSARATTTFSIVEGLLREGHELLNTNIFSGHVLATSATPGHLLISAASLILDLHRALYPIAHAPELARDTNLVMRWANDCRFLSDQLAGLRNKAPNYAEEKWNETSDQLKVLGETVFEDVVVREQQAVKDILDGAQGFVDVANSIRSEKCKNVVEQVLRQITTVAHGWKSILTRSAYLDAIGQIVDDALFRVMDHILSLTDIPEVDSERLSELCEMLTPLEDLFTDVPGESVVGSYVPLWFKFSYLSWLIKGSIADISYLFDQGMLVDYEVDELVRLLRALFAETPLRESTIAKVSKGHPIPVQHVEV